MNHAQQQLEASNRRLEYVLLPDTRAGAMDPRAHGFVGRETEVLRLMLDWLTRRPAGQRVPREGDVLAGAVGAAVRERLRRRAADGTLAVSILLLLGQVSAAQSASPVAAAIEHTYPNGSRIVRIADSVWVTSPAHTPGKFIFAGDTVRYATTLRDGVAVASTWVIRGNSAYLLQRTDSTGRVVPARSEKPRVIPAVLLTDFRDEPARAVERDRWRRSRGFAVP